MVISSITRSRLKLPGFLTRWKFAEALQPLGDVETGGRQQENVIHEPVIVIHALILSAFKRIGALPNHFMRVSLFPLVSSY